MQKCNKCWALLRRELGEYKVCSSCFKRLEDSDKRLLEIFSAKSEKPTPASQKNFLTYLEKNLNISIERLEFNIAYFSSDILWFFENGQDGQINFLTKLYSSYPKDAEKVIQQLELQRYHRDDSLASEDEYLRLPLESRIVIENYARSFLEEDSYSGPRNEYVENFITCFDNLQISKYLFLKSFKEIAVFVFGKQLKRAPTYVNILKLLILDQNPNLKLRMIIQPNRLSLSAKQSFFALGFVPRPTQLSSEKEPYVPKGYVSRSWRNRWRKD
jgi:hypothetical protein